MSCKKLIVGCLFFFISPLWAAQISRYTSRWAKVAQKLKIRIKSDKSTQTAPIPTDDSQKNKNKKNMLSIYPMNWTLVYKSEKQKTNIGHLIHCSKCTQTQTHIDGLFFLFFCGWKLCKHLFSFQSSAPGMKYLRKENKPKTRWRSCSVTHRDERLLFVLLSIFCSRFFFYFFLFFFFFSWATWHSVSQCFLLGILQQDKKHTCIIFQVLQGKTNVHLKIAFTNFWFRVYSPLDCQPSCLHFYRTSIESVTAKKKPKNK